MRLGPDDTFWVVTDPVEHSILGDVCFQTTLNGLRLQFAGGLSMEQHPTLFGDQDEAVEDAKNRLVVWKIAKQIRADRGLPLDEVVRVTLHDKDGTVLYEGDVPMRTATIDFGDGEFRVAIFEGGRRVDLAWGSYREMVAHATRAGVPRNHVTLTPAAQEAALAACFGGAA